MSRRHPAWLSAYWQTPRGPGGSDFHDGFAQHDRSLMELIASYTAGDDIIGSIWNDMSATKFTQYASIGGELQLLSVDGGRPANSKSGSARR